MVPPQLAAVVVVAALFGGALLTSQSLLYATVPQIYPSAMRGTGVGAAVGVGRAGSVAGPLVAAAILSLGATPVQLLLSIVPFVVLAGLFNLMAVWNSDKSENNQ